MKPDIYNNIYPEVKYKDKVLGIDNKGLLYDKNTLKFLSKEEAFEAYRYFYNNQDKI